MTPDAIVVGSGPNGLAAAITLAEGGCAVTVLERAGYLGGAVATDELTLPGFRHDTFSAVYPAAVASPVFARWPLERHGLRWVHPRIRCRMVARPCWRATSVSGSGPRFCTPRAFAGAGSPKHGVRTWPEPQHLRLGPAVLA